MTSLNKVGEIGEQDERISEEDMQSLFDKVHSGLGLNRGLFQFMNTSMFSIFSFLFEEQMFTGSCGDSSYIFSFLAGNSLDLDIMQIHRYAVAVTDPQDVHMFHDPSVYVYSVMNVENNPGFYYLSLMKEGYLMSNALFSKSVCPGVYVQKDGLSFLSSRYLSEYFKDIAGLPQLKGQGGRYEKSHSIQGPAFTVNAQNISMAGFAPIHGFDYVYAVKCRTIPQIATEFFTRPRGYWPQQNILEDIYHSGCYFVPKGKKGSDSFEYEWCISFAHAEKKIVHDMDSTAFGVLGILKLLTRNVFQPQIGDLLTSYMVKTSLFWTLEEINYRNGAQYSIVGIIGECIRRILDWVMDDFLPHYFVRQMNIIKSLFNNADRRIIKSCLRDTIQNIGQITENLFKLLLSSKILDELESIISTETEDLCVSENNVIQQANKRGEGIISTMFNGIFLGFICNSVLSVKECIYKLIAFYDENKHNMPLTSRKQIQGKIQRLRIIEEFKDSTNDFHNSIDMSLTYLENICVEDNTVILSNVIDLSTSCIFVERIQQGVKYLEMIVQFYDENEYIRLSIDMARLLNTRMTRFVEDLAQSDSILHGGQREVVIDNVCISLAESSFCPNAIFLEYMCMVYLSVDKCVVLQPSLYVIQIDPLVYACFLLFLCYRKLEENVKQLKSLEDLKTTCKTKDIDSPDIAWNLLGYCYIEMNQSKKALDAFYRATKQKKCLEEMIQRRPSQATNVFVAILINKQLTTEWSKVYDTE